MGRNLWQCVWVGHTGCQFWSSNLGLLWAILRQAVPLLDTGQKYQWAFWVFFGRGGGLPFVTCHTVTPMWLSPAWRNPPRTTATGDLWGTHWGQISRHCHGLGPSTALWTENRKHRTEKSSQCKTLWTWAGAQVSWGHLHRWPFVLLALRDKYPQQQTAEPRMLQSCHTAQHAAPQCWSLVRTYRLTSTNYQQISPEVNQELHPVVLMADLGEEMLVSRNQRMAQPVLGPQEDTIATVLSSIFCQHC